MSKLSKNARNRLVSAAAETLKKVEKLNKKDIKRKKTTPVSGHTRLWTCQVCLTGIGTNWIAEKDKIQIDWW